MRSRLLFIILRNIKLGFPENLHKQIYVHLHRQNKSI